MPDDKVPDTESTQSLGTLLADALQAAVFGNGLLILVIATVFAATVLLSRAFKGGTL